MANELVSDYNTMLQSESALFLSLFLINSRESSLITQLAAIALRNDFCVSNSELYIKWQTRLIN
jgi:hypothetical protein